MSDSPKTDCYILPVSEANYAQLLESHGMLERALIALTTNPHICLGDAIYQIREREGLGWDGPSVIAWSEAIADAKAALSVPQPGSGGE